MSFSKIEEISLNPPKMKKWKGTKLAQEDLMTLQVS